MVLDNPAPLAFKAACASALSYAMCQALGLPDGVSAAFVAVVCITPTVLAGLRRALGQALGSLIGGLFAALFVWLQWPTALSMGASIGVSVYAVFLLGFPGAHVVAAFTAIYVHLLQFGAPAEALWTRIASLAVGTLAAMVVNTLVSAMFYDRIFTRRLRTTVADLADRLDAVAGGDGSAIVPIFPRLGQLTSELAAAERELSWRRASAQLARARERRDRVRALARVAHFARDLVLATEDAKTELTAIDRALLHHAAAALRGRPSTPPEGIGQIGQRLDRAVTRFLSTALTPAGS